MFRVFFALALLGSTLFASIPLTLKSLERQKASRARDFMVWEFLQRPDITKQEAKKAYALVVNKNNLKIKTLYAKIVDDDIRFELECKKRKDLLAIVDTKCLQKAFSLYKTRKYNRFQRDELLMRGLTKRQKQLLLLQNEPYSFKRYRFYDPDLVVSYLLTIPKREFIKYFNKPLSKSALEFLLKASNFERLVMHVVTNYDLEQLQRSFFNIDAKKLSAKTIFYIGLNALRNGHKKEAIKFFRLSKKKEKIQRYIDKINFWLYLTTQERGYLQTMLLSMSINIYTLYAHEKIGIDVENYFDELDTNGKKSPYNLQNPFDWAQILAQIKKIQRSELFKLAKRFRYIDTLPVQRFIIEKAFEYKTHGYITPYERYLKNYSNNDKALIYAIMRQESDFIPSALSRTFAIGLMQLMPFLIEHIAKKQKESIRRFDAFFDPKKNLQYANIHLKWLKSALNDNPLFIAYSYNGGYGFFTRYKKVRFTKKAYEPFMSMEMMLNAQTREYGKRVLANYVMYKKIFGEAFSIIDFFEKLR